MLSTYCAGEKIPCSTKKCLNGGTVDPVACECKCTADYEGSACESKYKNKNNICLRSTCSYWCARVCTRIIFLSSVAPFRLRAVAT